MMELSGAGVIQRDDGLFGDGIAIMKPNGLRSLHHSTAGAHGGGGVAMTKRRRLTKPSPPLTATPPPAPQLCSSKPTAAVPVPRRSLFSSDGGDWLPLGTSGSELSLPLTLPTGQSFRWRLTSAATACGGGPTYTGVVGHHLISLAHFNSAAGPVYFRLHAGPTVKSAREALEDYFNLSINLSDLWAQFATSDQRFAELARRFGGGARVLRQDPVECVLQFLCSSNNNIARIEKMVAVISSYGEYLGNVGGFDFNQFPSLENLEHVSEKELRDAGFGYRAKYVVGTVQALQAKHGGGAKWLESLRDLDLHETIEALCTLPGVGPKVAACIALFSLDQHHAIPVDTHVWKIATRYLLPELAGTKLSPKLYTRVTEAFVARFGKYAGWAQNVLFIGELRSQKSLIES